MVLRIIMHFWCASSLLCLLSPCLSKVVQWFNVFRYRILYWCTKPPKFYDHYKNFCLLPPCKASLPETILSAFIDIMLLDDFLAICFGQIFGGQILWDRFRGTDFWGTDFRDQIFGDRFSRADFWTDSWHVLRVCEDLWFSDYFLKTIFNLLCQTIWFSDIMWFSDIFCRDQNCH